MLTREIDGLVASVAAHCGDAVAVRSTFYVLYVNVTVVSLQWSIAGGVTVLASRRSQHSIKLQKCGAGCGGVGLGGCLRFTGAHREKRTAGQKCRNPKNMMIKALHRQRISFIEVRSYDRTPALSVKSLARIGRRRIRLPVTAKIALVSAGATGGTPGSPTPVGFALLGTMYTSIFGDSKIRSI